MKFRTFPIATALALPLFGLAPLAQHGAQQRDREEPHRTAETTQVERALVVLLPIGGSGVNGEVLFEKQGEALQITGTVRGLSPGKHGFHVHEYGDLSDAAEGKSAGGHYSPEGSQHGKPEDERRHVGDLGNIEAGEDGVARIRMTDEVLALNGPRSILGRALVVHEGEDKFTQPTGDAGGRVAFGVVGVAAPAAKESK